MIDIHCHLMPGIDDGARNITDSLSLFRLAANDGIRRMVLTPHLHLGRFDNTRASIHSEFLKLKQSVDEAGIKLELAVAAEVRFDSEILDLLESNQLPLYGHFEGQQFMLLELPHSHIPSGTQALVKYLTKKNITPVIAHPERNRDLLKTPEKINSLVRLGCWFQLTAGSIVGQFGERCQKLSVQYLEAGLVKVVATDAHNIKHRPPILSTARERVVELLGEQHAEALFWQNPYNITASLFDQQ